MIENAAVHSRAQAAAKSSSSCAADGVFGDVEADAGTLHSNSQTRRKVSRTSNP